MVTIKLTQGREAQVSEEDREYLERWSWGTHSEGYAKCRANRSTGDSGRYLYMHRIVMERMTGAPVPPEWEIDHIDGDKLNNQRGNLRLVTRSQNNMNRARYKGSASQYKGVSRQGKKWRATIVLNKKQKHLGCYETQAQAARAYDEAARAEFGEHARLNFPIVWIDPETMEKAEEQKP